MATYTADAAQSYVQPRQTEKGVVTMIANLTANGNSVSTGDIYWMAKVPNGAMIIDLKAFGRSSGTGGIVFSVGLTSSASLFGAFTISATHQYSSLNAQASATQNLPYMVSLSDDAATQYITLAMTVASGTVTNTASFGMMVQYVMRGAAGP